MPAYKINKTTGNPDTLIAGGTLYADLAIGDIVSSGRAYNNPAPGFLYCDGRALSRTAYADLFKAIGTSFGSGDGSTTFNIPDMRGEFMRGAGSNSHANQGNGGTVGEHQDGTEHVGVNVYSSRAGIYVGSSADAANPTKVRKSDYETPGGSSANAYRTTAPASAGTENTYSGFYTSRPTNTSVNFFIKYKQIAVPTDFMAAVDDAVEDAMYYQRGEIENIEVLAGSMKLVRVNLNPLMPDAEYCVDVEPYNTLDAQCIPVGANERRTDHFNIIIRNISSTNVTNLKITWQAFRIPH